MMEASPPPPPRPPGPSRRGLLLGWLLAAGLTAGLYGLTMAPGLVWQDGGEFQLRLLTGAFEDRTSLSRSHVLHFLFMRALGAFATPAVAANLASVIAGTITIANVYVLCRLLSGNRLASGCATACLGLAHTFWQFSVQAEVYTLSTALLSAEVMMLVFYARGPALIWLGLAGLLNGAGLSTHNVAILTWPAYALAAWQGRGTWSADRARTLLTVLGAWLIGLGPLLWICLRAWPTHESVPSLIRSLLFGPYGHHVFNVRVSGPMVFKTIGYVTLNFPTPLLILIPVGWWKARAHWPSLLWRVLTIATVVHTAFVVRYSVPDQYTFFLPVYFFSAIFLACGLSWLLDRHRSAALRILCAVLSILSPVVYWALPSMIEKAGLEALPLPTRQIAYRDPLRWFLQPWRHTCRGPHRYATETLNGAPTDGILLLDSTVRPVVLYVQVSEQLRTDVQVNKARQQDWLTPITLTRENLRDFVTAGRVQASATQPGYISAWIAERVRFKPAGPVYNLVWPSEPKAPEADESADRSTTRPEIKETAP